MLFSITTKFFATVALLSHMAIAAPAPADIQAQSLAIHNQYRSKHHVGNVKWNADLAKHAASVAEKCVFAHSVMPGTGQNIAAGYTTIKDAIDAWYSEVKDYNFKTGTSLTGKTTGHFTQIVWKGTSEIGCSVSYCPQLLGGANFYVCDYKTPGNYGGQYISNVFAP